jgi:hypothetical protein
MGGQGVLIPGGMVLTAAHCIDWNLEGGLALGDWIFEEVQTTDGKTFRMQPVFVEPISDVAVLGQPDGGEPSLQQDYKLWAEFVDSVKPVELTVRCGDSVRILSHEGHWINAAAICCGDEDRVVHFTSEEGIKGGTSGGPVLCDDNNLLVGVVSNSGGVGEDALDGGTEGHLAFAWQSLPGWILRRASPDDDFNGCEEEGAEGVAGG